MAKRVRGRADAFDRAGQGGENRSRQPTLNRADLLAEGDRFFGFDARFARDANVLIHRDAKLGRRWKHLDRNRFREFFRFVRMDALPERSRSKVAGHKTDFP